MEILVYGHCPSIYREIEILGRQLFSLQLSISSGAHEFQATRIAADPRSFNCGVSNGEAYPAATFQVANADGGGR
jgi:hypothetical protein